MFIADGTANPSLPQRRGIYLHLSKTRIILIALLLVAPWVVILVRAATRPHPAISQPHEKTQATTSSSRPSPTGEWGQLEVTPITIEAPADAAIRFAQADTSTWYFADCTAEKFAGYLKSAGLTDSQRQSIEHSAHGDPAINGVIVKPDPEVLTSLSYDARSALYQILSEDSRNPQAEPFRRRPNPASDWFADIGLNDQAAALARRLVYRRGDMEAFADVSAILPAIHTDTERSKLFQTLSSQAVLVVRLRISPQSDIRALIDYWGKNDRQREVSPLLESLARVPGGDAVNIAQLLTTLARTKLYSYPQPVGSGANGPFDCHWTSLNFWNAVPDDRFSNPNYVREQLGKNYHTVTKPTQLGDVIFFLDKNDQGIHSATYIADDIVFTKNGTSVAAPWVLMRLPSLLTYYENIDPVKTMVFRKNGI